MSVLGAKIARKKNIPHLVTYHTMFTYLVKRMLPVFPTVTTTFISNLVSRIYIHQFDLVLAPSHKAVTSLHDSGSKTKVKLHYNGIPLSHCCSKLDRSIAICHDQLGLVIAMAGDHRFSSAR